MGPEVRRFGVAGLLGYVALAALSAVNAQEAPSMSEAPRGRMTASAPNSQEQAPPPVQAVAPVSHYDAAIFLKPIPADLLVGLNQFDGAPASDLMRDKQFKKVLKSVVPDCMFHYGRDMPLDEALDMAMHDSRVPVRVREGRYLVVSGMNGPFLGGRGFVWIDLKDGVGLGGFWFHPTNGEPTPTMAVFSRQVKEQQLSMSQLPPAFAEALGEWSQEARVSPVTTSYFITGSNKRVLLEHDEDYCSPMDGSVAPSGDACEQMNADAADLDETAAYYLDQVHYATNATAWMIGPDQVAWLDVRERTCGGVVDVLGCRIRVTRERTHLILRGGGGHPMPPSRPVHR